MENSEIHPHTHGNRNLIFNQCAKTTDWKKDNLFTNICGTTGYPDAENVNFNPHLEPYSKNIVKMDLRQKYKT